MGRGSVERWNGSTESRPTESHSADSLESQTMLSHTAFIRTA